MEKEAVSNTSSLLFIAKLNRFDLLKNMFTRILIPMQVKNEIFKKDEPENMLIEKERNSFIKINEVKVIKEFGIDEGEKEAISLCLEKNIKFFISDDKKARKIARSLELETIGMAGIILYNVEERKITKEEAKELIGELIKKGYYMSGLFYAKIMEKLN